MNHHKKLIHLIAGGYFLIWFDLFLGHVSARLRHPGMWLPLILLPIMCFISIRHAFKISRVYSCLFQFSCPVAMMLGVLGFGFHLNRLIHEIHGTISLEVLMRLMRYPPLFAPLSISGVGVLGFFLNQIEKTESK